jgi:hypothetical protein
MNASAGLTGHGWVAGVRRRERRGMTSQRTTGVVRQPCLPKQVAEETDCPKREGCREIFGQTKIQGRRRSEIGRRIAAMRGMARRRGVNAKLG